ncbi:hypothetical protein ACH5RR_026395 [Cinchona calisaya]|uniref:Uncharacterized protein n=1 Tax=Cinchona calisaya TaxID=153742 RepID=A0ABD2Z7H3_9GENT
MDSQQLQPQGNIGGSKRVVAVDESPLPMPDSKHFDLDHDPQDQKPGWRKFLSFVGPGVLVSTAYIDPGSMETNFQAGANHGYELLWIILLGIIFALIIQSLAANIGVCTGKHLSELCKVEYPKYVIYCLWLLAEIAVIAADIPEVIGTAFALNLLFHIPLWVGVLCTGMSTLLLLGVQRYGMRKLELVVSLLVFIIAACFFGELGYAKPSAKDLFKGMFVPKLSGNNAVGDAIALLGQLILPHNLFLHSALVLSRKIPNSVKGINNACRYFLIESGIPLFVAFLINVSMVAVPVAVCAGENLSQNTIDTCNNLNLKSASFLLKNLLGRSSSTIYGIALLASGQGSSITGTYAGQFIMQGFLDLKMKKWTTNIMTRSIAIAPSLIVSIIGGSAGAGQLIIIASIILSFELPFALIPLLKFSSSTPKMGPHKNSIYIIVISWILGLLIIGINIYFLITSFVGWLIHNKLVKVGKVFIGILVFPLMAVYILAVIYLMFRKDTVETFKEVANFDPNAEIRLEDGNPNQGHGDHVPYREDLADIPFPE